MRFHMANARMLIRMQKAQRGLGKKGQLASVAARARSGCLSSRRQHLPATDHLSLNKTPVVGFNGGKVVEIVDHHAK